MYDEPESPNEGACLRYILTKEERLEVFFAERACKFSCQRSHKAEKSQVI